MWDVNSEFSNEQRSIINLAGVTEPQLREFWSKFPELDLDAAIGGCLDVLKAQAASLEVPSVPEMEPVEEDASKLPGETVVTE